MIAFSRRAARRFRAAARKCTDRRGVAPPVVLRSNQGRITLTATFPDTTLELDGPAPADTGTTDAVLIVPMGVLDAVGGGGDDPVTFACGPKLTGTACWTERSEPRSVAVEFLLPGQQHDPCDRPKEMKEVAGRFLVALHEAGRTSSREDGRYALSRVQVRGQKGQVIATDGKLAVMFGGFTFPFTEDVLIPALPLFGCPEVRAEAPVRVGHTASHLVISAGEWTAWLVIAPAGKFPDVAAVVPRRAPTVVEIGDRDAAGLLPELPVLPGQGHELRPVTLDAVEGGVLSLHADDANGSRTLPCPNSPVQGPRGRVVLDRRILARALVLGCRTLRLTPDKAVVAEGDGVTVLAAPLDPTLAANPTVPARRTSALRPIAPVPETDPEPEPKPERNDPMKPQETNGHAPGGRHDPPTSDAPDPLVAAEELRVALADAARPRPPGWWAVLKASKKEQKVLAAVLTNLKQLNLGTGGPR